jgi:large subunit ribosomal protein L22
MEAIAKAKYLRGSAQKARLVIDMIRGKNVGDALAILQFTNKRAANPIEKCLRSAIANAEFEAGAANIIVDVDELWVKECFVDRGPTKRRFRFRPAPQGRAYRERRHGCHVTILVSSDEREEKEKKKSAPKKSVRAKRGGAAAAPRAKKVETVETKSEEAETIIEAKSEEAEVATVETKSEEVEVATVEAKSEEVEAATVETTSEDVAEEVTTTTEETKKDE